jgi:hypothetical protein
VTRIVYLSQRKQSVLEQVEAPSKSVTVFAVKKRFTGFDLD